MSKPAIKVKAMGLFLAHGQMLVTPSFNWARQLHHFRLLGGHVEFGERAEDTLTREMQEELAAEIEVLAHLDVIQNTFQYMGRPYHEIIFLYHARFLDDAITKRNDLYNLESDHDEIFRWHPIDELLNGPVPLYPATDYPGFLARIGAEQNG